MTAKQVKALQALLTYPTQAAAAQAAGIGVSTLKRYLDDDEFQKEYKAAFSALVSDAVRQAQKSLSPALTTLEEIMRDDAQTGQIRVSAARSLLEFSLKATEQLEIIERLKELETKVGDLREQ